MKKIYSAAFVLVLGLMLVPSLAFASWWNPLTWFNKPVTQPTIITPLSPVIPVPIVPIAKKKSKMSPHVINKAPVIVKQSPVVVPTTPDTSTPAVMGLPVNVSTPAAPEDVNNPQSTPEEEYLAKLQETETQIKQEFINEGASFTNPAKDDIFIYAFALKKLKEEGTIFPPSLLPQFPVGFCGNYTFTYKVNCDYRQQGSIIRY